jgi:hypothetical protein
MPSPFPGMDPWLEDEELFPDLHDSLITYLREALNAALPAGYIARMKNRVWVDEELRREPDVSLLDRGRNRPDPAGGDVLALPGLVAVGLEPSSDPADQPYLEIVSSKGKRLVTAIEVLSLANKRGGEKGRKAYQDKQQEYRLGGVNLVEIDLLRDGPHTTAVPLARLRRVAGAFDYHVSVVVAGTPNQFYAAPIRLADRLPAIGIPLDPGVPPVTADLQPLLDRAYDTGRYADEVRYDRPCPVPLTPEQQAWAAGVLKAKGLLP